MTAAAGDADPSLLPTFLVIGAMKAGTTSLHEYLSRHPDVFVPEVKEPHFFAANWDRGIDWYQSLFEPGRDVAARGESSTGYAKYPAEPDVPARLKKLVPDARFVYIVREPIARIRSHYLHNVLTERETRSVEDALLSDPKYVDCSRYAFQIEQYLAEFPREQVLVVRTDALEARLTETVERVLDFIGVDSSRLPALSPVRANETAQRRRRSSLRRQLGARPAVAAVSSRLPAGTRQRVKRLLDRSVTGQGMLTDDVRDELHQRLAPDVAELEKLTGESFASWGFP